MLPQQTKKKQKALKNNAISQPADPICWKEALKKATSGTWFQHESAAALDDDSIIKHSRGSIFV